MNNIEVINKVPKFIDFFDRSREEYLDQEGRFELWKETYNFAAVPPGEDGQRLAKTLLDNAWIKYEYNINMIRQWKPEKGRLEKYLEEIKELLGCREPVELVVIYFVGGFEGNPFVAPYDKNRSALCLPIETDVSEIVLYHELTHIVHHKMAGLKGEWERPIGTLILEEGLATRSSKHFVCNKKDESYIEFTQGWLASCQARKSDIIKGIIPYINDSSAETIMKFTFGEGTQGFERESYYVGWEMVGTLLEKGVSFEEMANIPADQIPYNIEKACKDLVENF